MNHLHNQLAAIQRDGANSFATSSLANSHRHVTRRVRRDRVVRGSVATLAGVGVAGAGTFGILQLRGADALAPMGTPSPLASGTPNPSPSPNFAITPTVTIEPGETADAVVARLAHAYGVTPAHAEMLITPRLPQSARGDIEGWLRPGPYDTGEMSLDEVAAQMTALQALELAKLEESDDRWPEILTIASLVEREAARAEDMAQIARVILNRTEADIRLELDSTVRYALGQPDAGEPFTTGDERSVDSLYNTYVHPGLPPGPIGMPSLEALEATINPAEGDWMYFVTVNPDTGETLFAEDFEQHIENVELLQEWAQANH